MGRPQKQEHEKLSETVKLRLTLAEHEHVRSVAADAGVTVSDYLRRRACGYRVPTVVSRQRSDPAVLSELNRIGVNLNQIARNLNSDRPLRLDAHDVLGELQSVLTRLVAGAVLDPMSDDVDGVD